MCAPWFRVAVILSAALASGALAAQDDQLRIQQVEYKGWKNNLKVSNRDMELVVTLDVGPRILSYRPTGGANVLKEYPEQLGKSGEKEWQIRGGHRLWVAPEDTTRTYALDNAPVRHRILDSQPQQVSLQQTEDEYGIQKSLRIQAGDTGTRVTLYHTLTNLAKEPTELAPWALTVMAPGGVEIIPLPAKKPHPGSPKKAKSAADFWPNQTLALWPYFDFKDPRWTFGSKYVTLRQDPKRGPTKIGLAHRLGWVGYLNGGTLFVKRIGYEEGKSYPDGGCNFETFTNEDMLEVESLGPLVKLKRGESVTLIETWELVKDVPMFKDEADIDRHILPRIPAK